ncbi:hypothetical protein [Alkalicoccobacillus porphyridii]|uniref:DUF1292 domain-containing protein n=1 Tax=Alkalicoccobacillus porphyridii TaxID=2597270 RepID=A0A553ZUR5_9BACI|nr:hypothetical protein [Alkalicoccobacillus porphyridii]TSB45238.1 hypothetical protein FN960_17385 [Alkalicoccobacillus porphyridii]
MDILMKHNAPTRQSGELIYAKNDKLYALIEDPDERYPYVLISLSDLSIIQYYDDTPTNEEISFDIEDEIISIHDHTQSKITIA